MFPLKGVDTVFENHSKSLILQHCQDKTEHIWIFTPNINMEIMCNFGPFCAKILILVIFKHCGVRYDILQIHIILGIPMFQQNWAFWPSPCPWASSSLKMLNKLYSHLYSQKRRSTETQEALAELTDSDRKMSANLFTHNSSFQMDYFAIFHILSPAEYLTGKYFFLIVIGQLL